MKTPIDIYLEREREFDKRFELESQGCSECGGFELIDKQEIRFPKGKYYCEFDLEKIKRWHSSSIKEILEGIVEIERAEQANFGEDEGVPQKDGKNYSTRDFRIGYQAAKQDTIDRLEGFITKLEQL
jgi:hypothetical protein